MTKVAASKEKVNFCIHISGTYYHVTAQHMDAKNECTVKYNFYIIRLIKAAYLKQVCSIGVVAIAELGPELQCLLKVKEDLS